MQCRKSAIPFAARADKFDFCFWIAGSDGSKGIDFLVEAIYAADVVYETTVVAAEQSSVVAVGRTECRQRARDVSLRALIHFLDVCNEYGLLFPGQLRFNRRVYASGCVG